MTMRRVSTATMVVAACALLAPPVSAQAPQLQGFSIVLVEGDLAEGKDSALPRAVQAAIGDIKDFLPFRSYRLLDSAWILGSNRAGDVTSRLRAGEQDFVVALGAVVADGKT